MNDKKYTNALEYCGCDLTCCDLTKEDLQNTLNEWEAFCDDLKTAFNLAIATLKQEEDEEAEESEEDEA